MIKCRASWRSGLLAIVLLSAIGCGLKFKLGELPAPATHLVVQQEMMLLGGEGCGD